MKMENKRKLLPRNKIFFADNLVRTVDQVRIAKREVKELNGKRDPEKELYCYSAIIKAEAMIERCQIFLEEHDHPFSIKQIGNYLRQTNKPKIDYEKIYELTYLMMHPKERKDRKKMKDIFTELTFMKIMPERWSFVAWVKWYQREKKKRGDL